MASKRIEIVGVVLFTAMLALTALQTFWQPIPESPVYGVTQRPSAPEISWQNWREGVFQKQFDAWVADRNPA